jgi:hypothetical protein
VKIAVRTGGVLLLLGFVLVILSDERESRRVAAISECLAQ